MHVHKMCRNSSSNMPSCCCCCCVLLCQLCSALSPATTLTSIRLCGQLHAAPSAAPCCKLNSLQNLAAVADLLLLLLDCFVLQCSFSSHEQSSASNFAASYMRSASAVSEMALQGGLLFVLLQSGLCPVFDAEAGQWTVLINSSSSSSSSCCCSSSSSSSTRRRQASRALTVGGTSVSMNNNSGSTSSSSNSSGSSNPIPCQHDAGSASLLCPPLFAQHHPSNLQMSGSSVTSSITKSSGSSKKCLQTCLFSQPHHLTLLSSQPLFVSPSCSLLASNHSFLGYLNQSPDGVIRSGAVNRHGNSVISVYCPQLCHLICPPIGKTMFPSPPPPPGRAPPIPNRPLLIMSAGHRFLSYLNQSPDEVIRSVVVNNHDTNVISVHSLASDTDATADVLRCTSTPAVRG